MSIPTTTAPPDRPPAATPGEQRPDSQGPRAREVVVGIDGSEVALSAARWAAREAAARRAPLRIVHAADYLGDPAVPGTTPPELPHARRLTATAYTAARHAAPGVQAATEIVPGDAVAALLRAGADSQLLVLGISTTGVPDEMVMAPVAQRVAARSPQPVVIVPRGWAGARQGRPVVAVLGLDDPRDDEAVAAFAREAARRGGRPLSVLQTRTGAEDRRAERFPDMQVGSEELPRARAVELLMEACPTPLMVLTAGHGGRFGRSLDALHRWLLRHCTSPMALVPSAARRSGAVPGEAAGA